MYVLESKDFLNTKIYYKGNWCDTTKLSEAKKYTLDEGMKEARNLKEFGGHYKVVRIDD